MACRASKKSSRSPEHVAGMVALAAKVAALSAHPTSTPSAVHLVAVFRALGLDLAVLRSTVAGRLAG